MKKLFVNNISLAFITSLICAVTCFTVHIIPRSNSMINFRTEEINRDHKIISNEYLTSVIDVHKTEPAFARRPLTTFLIEEFSKITSLNFGWAFTIINFFMLFIAGILICFVSLAAGHNQKEAVLSTVCFFLSFSVLFSFFRSNYSYDEPLQYIFIFIAFLGLLNKKWIISIIALSLAMITRESSVLLLPSVIFFLLPENKKFISYLNWRYLKKIIIISIPVFFHMVFLYFYLTYYEVGEKSKSDLLNRLYYFHFNFQNTDYAVESVTSLFFAIGLQLYLILWYVKDLENTFLEGRLIKSFIFALILNSVIVLLSTKARETRLFALPLVFIWPILGKVVLTEFRFIKTGIRNLNTWLSILFFLFLIFVGILISKYVYTPTEMNPDENFFHEYLGFTLVLISLHCLIRFLCEKKQKAANLPDAKK